MGQDWRPNKGLSTELILAVLSKTELQIESLLTEEEKWTWIVFGAYAVITYVLTLRGVEGLFLDLGGLIAYQNKGGEDHLIITLLGKIKGEHKDRCHLIPCVHHTSSGIDVQMWIGRIIQSHERQNRVNGPAITDFSGRVVSTKALDDNLVEILEEIYDEDSGLFPATIQSKDDICVSYQVFRSFRRSSDTQALESNVSKTDIDIVNRWHSFEAAKGNRPNLPMQQHYAQTELLLKLFLRYTQAM
jgi:hypothetical protein